jgi:signal transduction histidine kinase
MRDFLRRGRIDPRPLCLTSLIEETLKLIGADASARKTEVTVLAAPDVPNVQGDRIHLQQVLLNLILNSLEALSECPVGSRRLSIRLERTESGDAAIAVEDTGPGIPAERLAAIFEPFHTTKPSGLGLGLPICRSIMEAHGGRIRIDSLPGRGTTAWLTFPPAPPPVEAEAALRPETLRPAAGTL